MEKEKKKNQDELHPSSAVESISAASTSAVRRQSQRQTNFSDEQTSNERLEEEHKCLEQREPQSDVNDGEGKDDDAISEEDDDEIHEKEKEKEIVKEKGCLSRSVVPLSDYPPLGRFAMILVRTPGQVERSRALLKSLSEDNLPPDVAFKSFWGDEAFKKKLVHEYLKVATFRSLIDDYATEERVENHEARMTWVKEVPFLATDVEDGAHLMRIVLSLSMLYWMDIRLHDVVDLRGIIPIEMSREEDLFLGVARLCDNKALRRFAWKLAITPGQVERANDLLKSLREDTSPNEAFQNFWGDEGFKKKFVDEWRKVGFRILIQEYATEKRLKEHEARMAWVNEDPILWIDIEDDTHLMRNVLSVSMLYWMDINLYNIVDLCGIVPREKNKEEKKRRKLYYVVDHLCDSLTSERFAIERFARKLARTPRLVECANNIWKTLKEGTCLPRGAFMKLWEDEAFRKRLVLDCVSDFSLHRSLLEAQSTLWESRSARSREAWFKEDPILWTIIQDDAHLMRNVFIFSLVYWMDDNLFSMLVSSATMRWEEGASRSASVDRLCDKPTIERFARKLVKTSKLVECAKVLLKSLKDGTETPDVAFHNFWDDEDFKKQLEDEYRNDGTMRRLVNQYATKERVEEHDTRMAWVKEDPFLVTDVEDDDHVMRSVLSLSMFYWVDDNLKKIVDLCGIVPTKMTEEEKEQAKAKLSCDVSLFCDLPFIERFAKILATTTYQVECARGVLKSLKEDICSPNDAFKVFWKACKNQFKDEYKGVGMFRRLINDHATEERVDGHEARMDWVKGDPILGTKIEDEADFDLIRKVLSLSVVYWMDINMHKIVGLSEIVPTKLPVNLIRFEYIAENVHDEKALRKQIDVIFGKKFDQEQLEDAFKKCWAPQLNYGRRNPEKGVGLSVSLSYNPGRQKVTFACCSDYTPKA